MRQAVLNKTPISQPKPADENLVKEFNSALLSTRAEEFKENATTDLATLVSGPAFQAVLAAASLFAAEQGISERQAAEEMIRTFRKVDQIWTAYLFDEGLASILKN